MKTLLAMAVGTVPLLTTSVALAQNGNMMNGGMWGGGWMGGYGGIWGPILLVIVVVGVVAWLVKKKGK
jgi:asparagine N-glycosylation enzyme membrane subunit Stt3